MTLFRSLRNKLLALVLLATLSALAVAGSIFLLYDISSYRGSIVNDLRTQIELLSYASVPALQFEDPQVATTTLDLLKLRPTIRSAAIYDAHGRIFATYLRADETRPLPDLPGEEGLAPGADSLDVFSRVMDSGAILGMAYISADYQPQERILSFIRILSLAAFGALVVALLVSLWLQGVITRPILAIAGVARDVVLRKEYTKRAQKLSNDEVGTLVDAFNDMLSEIGERTTALEDSNLELEQEIAERTRARETILRLNEELEGKVVERTQQLQTINKELESFCYSVSHDLRGPLRSISGFSQALIEELPADMPGDGRRYLDKIMAATQRMGQLIEDLLNLSKVSRGELKLQAVNLSDMAWEVIRDLQARDPALKVEVSVWTGIVVQADPRQLRIALENLLGNAWKFTSKQDKPVVIVGLMKDGAREVCFVRDNGVGFDMRYADKLFGAFQRLHGMTEFPGTGIGLATVQRIIHRHGGRIWFDSSPGNGAVFYFTLKDEPHKVVSNAVGDDKVASKARVAAPE